MRRETRKLFLEKSLELREAKLEQEIAEINVQIAEKDSDPKKKEIAQNKLAKSVERVRIARKALSDIKLDKMIDGGTKRGRK